MSNNLGTVAFGLAASLSWGAGDFSGGLATRRTNVFSVVFAAHLTGLVLLIALALAWSEPAGAFFVPQINFLARVIKRALPAASICSHPGYGISRAGVRNGVP